jgi:hypothetical protein
MTMELPFTARMCYRKHFVQRRAAKITALGARHLAAFAKALISTSYRQAIVTSGVIAPGTLRALRNVFGMSVLGT